MFADRHHESAPGVTSAEGHTPTAGAGPTLPTAVPVASAEPMHASPPSVTRRARARGMAAAMCSAPAADCAAVFAALMKGFQIIRCGRAEDALRAAGFIWPASAPARCLGPITRSVARLGLIQAEDITKGLTTRSHAGRVTWWRWVGGAP